MDYLMIFGLLGGLGLFVYGMKLMGDGLQKVAGERLKKILEVLTSNRYLAVLVGAGVTAIIQSSSATTVMTVGFVNAGLMNLFQAAGVMMGANIGTTITAQLLAFNLTDVAPLILAIGAAMVMFGKKKKTKDIGGIVLGFGVLFVGMEMMKDSMAPLRELEGFQNLIISIGQHPILGIFVGLAMTATVQSSSATIGILIALASNGAIDLTAALPILFGDNIGTCVTALLASIGTNKNAKRAALIHLTFNIVGTTIFMLLMRPLLYIIPLLGGDITRQIANTHTIFNIANVVIQVPFLGFLVAFVNKIIPGKDEDENQLQLIYLDKRILETPSIAVGQVVKEVVRMQNISNKNVNRSIEAFIKQDEKIIVKIEENEEVINYLNREITSYLVALSNAALSEYQSDVITSLFHIINDIERIGDHAENIGELAQYRIDKDLKFSDSGLNEIKLMGSTTAVSFENAVLALENFDFEAAKLVIKNEKEIDALEKKLREVHIERLSKYICQPASGALFLDILVNLERIGDHSNNIAQLVLEFENGLKPSL
ncbi:MAG: Na/Pi cotransporter family protein [Clostridiaceae bacterium]